MGQYFFFSGALKLIPFPQNMAHNYLLFLGHFCDAKFRMIDSEYLIKIGIME